MSTDFRDWRFYASVMAGIGSLYIVYKFIFRDIEEIPPLNEDQKIDDKNDLPNVNQPFGDFSAKVGPYEQDAGEDSTFYSFLNIYAGTDNQRRDVQDTPLYKLNPPPVDTRIEDRKAAVQRLKDKHNNAAIPSLLT